MTLEASLVLQTTSVMIYGQTESSKEYPENLVQDTLNALEFMQTLRSMRTIAILNEPDRRMTSMLKQKLAILEQNMEEEKARGSQLEVDLQQAMNRLGEKDIKVQQFEFQIDQLRFRDEARIDGLKNELKKTQDELESRKVEGAYYDSKRKAEYVGLVWEVNRSRTAHVQTKIDAQLKSLALEDFNATVSQLEGIVSSRDTILKDKDITIQSQQAELTNTRQEKEKLSQNLHRLGGTVSNLEQDIVQLKRTIHDLDRGRSELIKEVAELTAEKEHAKGKKSKLASMKATAAQQKMVIKALETRAQKAESSLAAASSQLDALSTLRKATASPALDMPQQSSAAPTDQSSVGARKVGKNDRTGALAGYEEKEKTG
ncbi:hypothetical protein BX666DRAFT_1877622 [Dichotomocladium elegans]|nr:hypothetical protein BX666DRAFT_1877622 [Dichotomocladium elegans]